MVVGGLTEKNADKLKRAQAGEFMVPQSVDLANPTVFRCVHCGRSSNLKKVLLQCWPDRNGEKAGLIVVCPACGCRKQVPYVATKEHHPSNVLKILAAVAALLVFVVLTFVFLWRLGLPPFAENYPGDEAITSISTKEIIPDELPEEEIKKRSHYEVMQADVTWDEAEERCEGRTYNGVSGHLAVITSQEEYDSVVAVLNEYISTHPEAEKMYYVWLGAWIDDTDAENYIFNYRWVTGEDWSYENWCSTYSDEGNYIEEPSFYDGDLIENRLILWGYQREKLGWTFSDQNGDLPLVYPSSQGEIGYICEYDESEPAS